MPMKRQPLDQEWLSPSPPGQVDLFALVEGGAPRAADGSFLLGMLY